MGNATTIAGYDGWNNTKPWRQLPEVILEQIGRLKLPKGRHPQEQIEKLMQEHLDEDFEDAIVSVPMADLNAERKDGLSSLQHYRDIFLSMTPNI